VPEKNVKVIIAFSPDESKIGKTVELPAAEAQQLINEGRARLAAETKAEPKAEPKK
jgi:hypothetical protein